MSDVSTAFDIARDVRSGALKAADVVEEHLARIAARDGEIHAFNLVLGGRRRVLRPQRSTRRRPRATTRARSPACRSR